MLKNSFLLTALWISVVLVAASPATAQDHFILNDGSAIQYYLALPRDDSQSSWPLAIFMGGGSGNRPISFTAYRYFATELASLGWVVAVPISPNNRSFRGDNVAKVRELIAHLQARDDIEEGKLLIGGISAGGGSALEIARLNPQDFLGVLAVPAVIDDAGDIDTLSGMPVYLRIGGEDELGWADRFEETVTAFETVGVQLDAAILPGQPHMFSLDWERLEDWLEPLHP